MFQKKILNNSRLIIIGFILGLWIIFALVFNWKIAFIPSTLFFIFVFFHQLKNLQSENFEINLQNKDKQKGLVWYKEKIEEHLHDLNYEIIEKNNNLIIFRPSPRARIMGGEVKILITPYSISMQGPRGVIRILCSILDIKKIFL